MRLKREHAIGRVAIAVTKILDLIGRAQGGIVEGKRTSDRAGDGPRVCVRHGDMTGPAGQKYVRCMLGSMIITYHQLSPIIIAYNRLSSVIIGPLPNWDRLDLLLSR